MAKKEDLTPQEMQFIEVLRSQCEDLINAAKNMTHNSSNIEVVEISSSAIRSLGYLLNELNNIIN